MLFTIASRGYSRKSDRPESPTRRSRVTAVFRARVSVGKSLTSRMFLLSVAACAGPEKISPHTRSHSAQIGAGARG